MMMDLQKRPPQYPSPFGASHDPRAASQPPPAYSVPPPQQVYYDSLKQHGIPSSQPANAMAYPYSTSMSSAPPTPASSTPYNMSAALRVDNHSYQVPQMDYEPPKRHDDGQKDHNKRHRRSHSRKNSHDQLIYREGRQYYFPLLLTLLFTFFFPPSSVFRFTSYSFVIPPSLFPSRSAVEDRWTPCAGHSRLERRVP